MNSIKLWGVRQNNLKNLNVEFPLFKMTVLCGPSGSGKSSLAFETLYAEGQRRYIESLSSYARQFLHKAPQPLIEDIENIPPALAIEQHNSVKTSRSTVGTLTELNDYLRLLFEKIGKPHCPNHHTPIVKDHPGQVVDKLFEHFDGARGYVLAPIKKAQLTLDDKKLAGLLQKDGIKRFFVNGEVVDFEIGTQLPSSDFELVVDRVAVTKDDRARLLDSVSQCYQLSLRYNSKYTGGKMRFLSTDQREMRFTEENACSICDFTFPKITSAFFSFSSPVGACSTCSGFGNQLVLDEFKIVPKPSLSIKQGALAPFEMPSAKQDRRELLKFCEKAGVDPLVPWESLSQKDRETVWNGSGKFSGVKGLFDYLETKKYKMHVRVFLSRYKTQQLCTVCHGSRLRPEAAFVLIGSHSIQTLSKLTLGELLLEIGKLDLSNSEAALSKDIRLQLTSRLKFLSDVGVPYLNLDRATRTLSGGEYQRIQLANQLGMGLSQILYVLDEPTIGLHPRDNHRLIDALKGLVALRNTLVVVEHDADVIKSSDYVIEMGPGSGPSGGEIVYSGSTKDFLESNDSLTARYLNSRAPLVEMHAAKSLDYENLKFYVGIKGARGHNLKNINVKLPLNSLVTVAGVSGSGKSSLITQTLYPALHLALKRERISGLEYDTLEGHENLRDVVLVDQSSIGRSSRSNPLTYLKVFDEVRKLFAALSDAIDLGFTAGTFSLNVSGGRCDACQGDGVQIVDMLFMDDVTLTCEECGGKRYNPDVLTVRYKGKNINEVLNMTVQEASLFFSDNKNLKRALGILKDVGLDHIQLGQSSSTFSGGELQRLKLAREFMQSTQRATLYILDEPTTGLHFREIELLLKALCRLIQAGGSVIMIEHNMDVIRNSDFVIEIGPEGGGEGGHLLFAGAPKDLIAVKSSPTAKYLEPYFSAKKEKKPNTGPFSEAVK
ncbi:MAG: excinuclease ABC subunit A [Bdellovibrionales bacterium CG10_big_fil_rev_8_21_14_0_10_45_34]|nr:MAG: excinuclease ABC subunit A [Bdellovibrionales bacterium CG10_big_fil_rev_8_21_14_0_10_45_34]